MPKSHCRIAEVFAHQEDQGFEFSDKRNKIKKTPMRNDGGDGNKSSTIETTKRMSEKYTNIVTDSKTKIRH